MELADWDLLAVVRGCSSTTTTTTTTTSASQNLPPPTPQPTPNPPPSYHGGCEDLQDLYKPFFPNLKPSVPAPLDFGGGFMMREQLKLQQRPPQQQILFHQQPPQTQGPKESHQLIFGSGSNTSIITSQLQNQRSNTPHTQQRPKKRKNLQKKVCHLPVEGLSSDMWAWRKYGQKPIKGSPYPRGYYRCSSSKGCPARKQVERNRSNPKMFIITYTSEHNHPMPTHRNSLAGSTRQKPASGCGSPGNGSHPAASSSPSVGDSGNDEMEVFPPDMVLDDDFFSELDDMDGADVLLCDQIKPPFVGVGVDFLDQQNWESGLLHS